jgi:hypothetical protein
MSRENISSSYPNVLSHLKRVKEMQNPLLLGVRHYNATRRACTKDVVRSRPSLWLFICLCAQAIYQLARLINHSLSCRQDVHPYTLRFVQPSLLTVPIPMSLARERQRRRGTQLCRYAWPSNRMIKEEDGERYICVGIGCGCYGE